MKEDTFYVFTLLQSPLRGAHYLLRESFTNIEKFAEKKGYWWNRMWMYIMHIVGHTWWLS